MKGAGKCYDVTYRARGGENKNAPRVFKGGFHGFPWGITTILRRFRGGCGIFQGGTRASLNRAFYDGSLRDLPARRYPSPVLVVAFACVLLTCSLRHRGMRTIHTDRDGGGGESTYVWKFYVPLEKIFGRAKRWTSAAIFRIRARIFDSRQSSKF